MALSDFSSKQLKLNNNQHRRGGDMIDINKTFAIVKGGLLDPANTWDAYLGESHTWQETTALLSAPLIIVSAIASAVLAWVFSSHYMFAASPGPGGFFIGIIAAFAGLFLAALIFSFFAGVFKGEHDFNNGLAAVSLAAIPSYVGAVVGTLPWIGWLLSLALTIVGLVFLYKIIPSYLKVPQQQRLVHFAVSLLVTVIAAVLLGMVFGIGSFATTGQLEPARDAGSDYGMLGGIGRQAELMEQAANDRYTPPADGKISAEQMAKYLATMQKVVDLRAGQQKSLEQLQQHNQDNKDFSFSDIGALTSGMNAVIGSVNAEMEVVKTAGGNWAEHRWIREQLRTAMIQKDISDAVKHNYALYQEHEQQLRALME
jgi:hypothetical protein